MNAVVPDGLPGEVRHRHLDVSGAELAVVEVGAPDLPAVLLAHGAGSSARFVCAAFGAAVLGSGRRLVTYDLRGHGSSSATGDPDDHHLDVHVADLIEIAFDLEGDIAVIGGISLGGHAAVRMVASGALRPSAVLACLPAWTGPANPGEGPHAVVAAEVRSAGIDRVIDRLRTDPSMPRWLRATLVEDYARHDRHSLATALLALDGGDAPTEVELSSLRVPLAVVGWPDDPGHPEQVAADWVSAAPRGVLGRTAIAALEEDVAVLGEVAVATIGEALASQDVRDHRAT